MKHKRRRSVTTPRHILAAATPFKPIEQQPPNCLYKPAQLNMWGNDTFGDCVTAEEAFAKACFDPEIFIPSEVVEAWATLHSDLNGANIADVLTVMQTQGFIWNSKTYNDGPANSVDWTNTDLLQNAIAQGPVKIGVAAAQLENVATPGTNGWFATGFTQDENEDHCVSLCGYGTMDWLAEQFGVMLPSGLDGSEFGYALYTWDSIGIIDIPSLLNICGEAWLRTPTTVVA